jgi:hypothetical protein
MTNKLEAWAVTFEIQSFLDDSWMECFEVYVDECFALDEIDGMKRHSDIYRNISGPIRLVPCNEAKIQEQGE